MTAVPNRAQNYIPISNRNKMKFAAEPKRIKTKNPNLAYLDDRRIQKQPVYVSRPANTAARPAMGSAAAARKAAGQAMRTMPAGNPMQQKKPASIQQAKTVQQNVAMPRKNTYSGYQNIMQGSRISAQGEIAIPIPRTKPGKNETARKPASEAAARPVGVVSTIVLIAFVFGVLSFLLARNATISDIGLENAKIQKSITTLTQNLDKVKLDITLKEDLNSIQQRASQLNMKSPDSGQITYLPNNNTAASSATAVKDTQDTSSNEQSFSLNNLFKEMKDWFN